MTACGIVLCVTRPSMFDAAGGLEAFERLAAAHHQRCLEDPVLEHPFSHGGHPQHVERLGHYWAEVFGGPPRYSEVSAGQSFMLGLHAGMDAQDDLGDRFVTCFVKAIDDAGLPDDPELRDQLRAYMEWAVGQVHAYNPRGSVVPGRLPIPRWSWDGLAPTPAPPD
jgi:hemoglobin